MPDSEDDYRRAEADRRRAAIDKDNRTATEIVRLQERISGNTELHKQRFDDLGAEIKDTKAAVVKSDTETKAAIHEVKIELNTRISNHEADEKPKIATLQRWMYYATGAAFITLAVVAYVFDVLKGLLTK